MGWVGERQLDRQADIAGSVRTPVASTVQTPDPLTPFFSPANFKSRLHPPASRPLYSTPQQTSRAVIFLEATSPSWKQLYPWGNTSFPLLRNIPCNCSISCISTFPGTRHNPSPSFLHFLFMSTYRLLGCILQAGLVQKGAFSNVTTGTTGTQKGKGEEKMKDGHPARLANCAGRR